MKKDEKPMEWGDFTNKILGIIGKYVLIPLVIIGAVLVIISPVIGLAIIFSSAFLFLMAVIVIVILKPVITQKYPEPKQPEKPANFEHMSLEERRALPYQSRGRYMVDPSEPYEEMNKLHRFAADNFNGDLQLAMHYIFTNFKGEELDSYAENLSDKDAEAYTDLILTSADQMLTTKEKKELVRRSFALAHLDMEEEDVLKTEKNPFVKKLLISLGCLLACSGVIALLLVLADEYIIDEDKAKAISILIGCGSSFFVYRAVRYIMNSIRFKVLKRKLEKERKEQEEKENNQ